MSNTTNKTETEREWEGKILCDCPCPGPFCNDLTHPCSKPDEHYLQSLEPLAKEYTRGFTDALERVEKEVIGEGEKGFVSFKYLDRNELREEQLKTLAKLKKENT